MTTNENTTTRNFRKGQIIYTATHRLQVTKITSRGNVMAMSRDSRTGVKGGSINWGTFADFAAAIDRMNEKG